jgi:hypothetical protein
MSSADSMVHLFQDLVSFMSIDTPKEDLLSIGSPVEDASLVDVGGESSL